MVATSCCRGRLRVLWRHRLGRLRRGRASKDTHGIHGTGKCCSRRVSVDGSGSIQAPTTGAHQFRHALATQMLRRGASLTEIGEVLRHRSPETTKIYTKVDLNALRRLAVPWPGGVR